MTFSKEDTKIIKGIAICLMLCHHLFAFPERIGYKYITIFGNTNNILGQYGKMCVGIFFFLGGYGMYKSYKNNYFNFVKKKIISLYKSYWKVLFIVVPISLLLKVPSVTLDFKTFIGNLLGYNLTYNGEWWFLATYLLIILLGPLLFKLFDKFCKKIIYGIVMICLVYIFCVIIVFKILPLNIFDNFNGYMMFFYIRELFIWIPVFTVGIFFAKYNLLDLVKKYLTNNYLMAISSLMWIVFSVLLRQKLKLSLDFIYVPIFIVSSVIILSLPIMNILKKILLKIGKVSTNIWLTHSFFCYKWCQKFIFMPKLSILIFLLLLIVSYIFSVIINKFYDVLENNIEKIRNKNAKQF